MQCSTGHCQDAAKNFHGDVIAGRVLLPILLSIQLFNGTIEEHPVEDVKAVTFYVMGPNYVFLPHTGNYWTSLDDWYVLATSICCGPVQHCTIVGNNDVALLYSLDWSE